MARRWIRRVVRWAGVFAVLLVLLVAVGVGVFSTSWFRDVVRRLAVSHASALINGDLAIGSLSGSLVHGVTLTDVVITQPDGTLARIDSLNVSYDVLGFLHKRASFGTVVLTHPVIWLRQGARGWNVTHLLHTKNTPGGVPWLISIGRVEVANGELHVVPSRSQTRDLAEVTFDGALGTDGRRVSLDVRTFSARDIRTGLRVVSLTGDLAIDPDSVRVDHLDVRTAASHLSGRATYGRGAAPSIDGGFQIDTLSFAEARPYLPSAAPHDLRVQGQFAAIGPLTALDTTWSLVTDAGASTGHLTVDVTHTPVSMNGDVQTTTLNLAPMTNDQTPATRLTLRGHVSGALDLANPADSPFAFSFDAPVIQVASYAAADVQATGRMAGASVDVKGEANAYGGRATFDGTVQDIRHTATVAIRSSGTVSALDLTNLPSAWRVPVLSTAIGGRYTFAWRRGSLDATLAADASRIEDATVEAGTVASVSLEGEQLSVQLDGAVRHVSGRLIHVPLQQPLLLGGSVHAAFAIADISHATTPGEWTGRASADLAGSTFAGATFDRALVQASLDQGMVAIDGLDLHSSPFAATARGRVAIAGDGASDLTYKIDAFDLAALSAFGAANLRGAAHVEGRVEGPADGLTATGTVSAEDVHDGDLASVLTLNGQFGANVPLRDLARTTASGRAVASFLTVKSSEIEQISLQAAYGARDLDLDAHVLRRGQTMDVAGSVRFAPEAREIRLHSFSFAGPGAPWTLDASRGDVVISYAPTAVTVDQLALVSGSARVEAAGTIALDQSAAKNASFHAKVSGIDVASVYQLAIGTPQVKAFADADVTLTGVITQPVAHGTIDVGAGYVAAVPFSRAAVRADFEQSRLSIEARVEEPSGASISAVGVVPVSARSGDIDLHVVSHAVDLGLLQAFTTAVQQVTGQAVLDLHVTGPLDHVDVSGTAGVNGGGFLVQPTGVTYKGLAAAMRFDGQRVMIEHFSINDSDGHVLTASGSGDFLSSTRAIDVSIKSDGMHLLNNELGEVEATADVQAIGELAAPRVSGTIRVTRARIQVDELLRQLSSGSAASAQPAPTTLPTLSQMRHADEPANGSRGPAAAVNAPPSTTGLFSRAQIALAVTMPDDVVLRGRDLHTSVNGMGLGDVNMTIGGTVRIQKTPGQAPVILGSAEAVRGTYSFQGRRFDVQRGSTVTFRGSYPIDPSIDVTGDREVSGIVAEVHVTGTARRPRVQLSSDPPLDQSDVLSLIIFNAPVSQLGDSQQVDIAGQAERMAASAVATPLASAIGQALDLDVFEILTPSAGEAGQVEVGHQVSERLFVGFRQEFGESQASRLSFDYRITRALSVLTSLGQGQDRTRQSNQNEAAGVDLLFTLRY